MTHHTQGITALTVPPVHGTLLPKGDSSIAKGNLRDAPASALVSGRVRAVRDSAGTFGPYVRQEEADAVLATLAPESARGTLVRFLWQAGPRLSEALGVTAGDIDFGQGVVRVRTLKRRSISPIYRLVPIQVDLQGLLARHVAHLRPVPTDLLWPWTRQHVWKWLHDAMQAAGVPAERCHPHSWRHGLAVNLIRQGVPMPIVQQQLGHASITTTAGYAQFTILDRIGALKGVRF
jgi:site-specific recombinase XerD